SLCRSAFCQVLCIKVITSRRAASVIAKFSLTNATYNFIFVDCSVILALKQRLSAPQNPSALSIFNYHSGSQTFSVIPHFEQGGLSSPTCPSSLRSEERRVGEE